MRKNLLTCCLLFVTVWTLQAQDKNYFPLTKGTTVTYQVNHYATADKNRFNIDKMLTINHEREFWGQEMLSLTASEPTEKEGKTYTPLMQSEDKTFAHVRIENGTYYRTSRWGEEECFLKTNQEKGDTWIAFEGDKDKKIKRGYQLVNKMETLQIRGIEFKDVICVRKVALESKNDGKFHEVQDYGVYYFYAAGKGLVYSYEPYPMGGTYTDKEMFIME